tara:strand:- start:951 stop:1811 length:861 start_codon:yes stop_codon:yes gene_type:complete
MSKKIDFQILHNFIQFVQSKEKWKISEILENMNITKKELFYILDIFSQIYTDYDDILIDYEVNEDAEEINFFFNDSVVELSSINDSELFNLYYLLTMQDNFVALKDSTKEIMEFYKILSEYFDIDGLPTADDQSDSFSFEEINTIEYIKLGKTEAQTYFINPIALKSNQDGKILEALDIHEKVIKTFLIDRIVGININESITSQTSSRSTIRVKYQIKDNNFLKTLDSSTFKVNQDNLIINFYSFENAIDFSIKNRQYINVLSPVKIIDEIKIRQDNLLENLNEFN